MRKPTEPGAPAPPGPGSVGPMFGPPPVPRKLTPGATAYTSEDEIPTKPDASAAALDPEALRLVRLFGDMPPVERRRFVALGEHYVKCPLGRRVLLEELAREFAGKGTT